MEKRHESAKQQELHFTTIGQENSRHLLNQSDYILVARVFPRLTQVVCLFPLKLYFHRSDFMAAVITMVLYFFFYLGKLLENSTRNSEKPHILPLLSNRFLWA